ncbi:Gfo/Idh/MocA family protein [Fictibacillus terranigra]|uniref:Gfo/Idh/MocA family oxidoreductase n=1 Tax=Fictibacillus terranigra TaxID=3058424 RepID=A0ABT8EDM3_9BACL|nr:Gfo/Idh/MocA family oxidoreductase [Fictibacillus sp. CENA-BCM004]MDN4075919.1 Gfo/Idh/MocA family oxidoreductase [Fictibacillus sp. CENA-BCM004]
MKQIKVGVIGASWFADLWYLPVLSLHPNAELSAICSEKGNNARLMAGKYGIPRSYTSYEEMIVTENLDGVCIITPNRTHADMVLTAAKNGLHIICEKPLTLNAEESAKIVDAVKNSSIIHAVNFTYRENPAIKKMKNELLKHRIGNILEADFEYTGDYGIQSSPGWRSDVQLGGEGGVLADLGSHLIDLAHYLFDGSIRPLSASTQILKRDHHEKEKAPDSVFFAAKLPNDAIANFQTSWVRYQGDRGQTIKINLYGDKGKIKLLSTEFGIQLSIQDERNETYKWKETEESGEENFRPWRLTPGNEIWKWIDRISSQNSAIQQPDFYDGHQVQNVMEQILQLSSKQNNKLF